MMLTRFPRPDPCDPELSDCSRAAAAARGSPLRTAASLWGRAAGRTSAAAAALSAPIRHDAGEEHEEEEVGHLVHEEEVGLLRPCPSSPSCPDCHTHCCRRLAETPPSCAIPYIPYIPQRQFRCLVIVNPPHESPLPVSRTTPSRENTSLEGATYPTKGPLPSTHARRSAPVYVY
jgi:hypothetical protein